MSADLAHLYQVKKFKIAHDGNPVQQEIVAAVTSPSNKKIVVLSYVLTGATTDGTAIWESASTDLSGAMQFQADGGSVISVGHHPRGCLETVAGEALNITSSGIALAGHGTYVEVGGDLTP